MKSGVCQTICRLQSKWVPTFLSSWSKAPSGPVVSTLGSLPQVDARVQSQCHLNTSLLSAAPVWVCEKRQADYQGIYAPATLQLQFPSAEMPKARNRWPQYNLVCSLIHLCNNLSRQQLCVSCIPTKDYDGDTPKCFQDRVPLKNFVQSPMAGRCRKSRKHAASVRTSEQGWQHSCHRRGRRKLFRQTTLGRE